MKKAWLSLLAAFALSISDCRLQAQEKPRDEPPAGVAVRNVSETPSVDDLVSAALDRTPAILTLKARLAASRERTTVSSSLPDPTLSVSVLGMGVERLDPYSYLMVEYRQELPYPGKRDARAGAAEAETAFKKAELEDLRRKVTARIRFIYANLYALEKEETLLKVSKGLISFLRGSAEARYRAGKTGQEEILSAQLELSRADERMTEIESQRRELIASLNRLLESGRSVKPFSISALPAGPLPEGILADRAAEGSSEMAIRKAAVRLAEKRISETKLGTKPDFGVGGGLGVNAGPMPMVLFKFDVQLPVWSGSKIQPSIKASELECEAAREDLRDTEASVRDEAERLLAQYVRSESIIVRYRDGIIPQSRQVMEAARNRYSSGTGELAAVISGFRGWVEAETQLARKEADRYMAWAGIDSLLTPSKTGAGRGGE